MNPFFKKTETILYIIIILASCAIILYYINQRIINPPQLEVKYIPVTNLSPIIPLYDDQEEVIIDYGKLKIDNNYKFSFVFENKTNNDVCIYQINLGCACSKYSISKSILGIAGTARDTARFDVYFDTFSKKIGRDTVPILLFLNTTVGSTMIYLNGSLVD